jgi:hypothetical protein
LYDFKYLLKIDTDTWVAYPNILTYLLKYKSSHLYMGIETYDTTFILLPFPNFHSFHFLFHFLFNFFQFFCIFFIFLFVFPFIFFLIFSSFTPLKHHNAGTLVGSYKQAMKNKLNMILFAAERTFKYMFGGGYVLSRDLVEYPILSLSFPLFALYNIIDF